MICSSSYWLAWVAHLLKEGVAARCISEGEERGHDETLDTLEGLQQETAQPEYQGSQHEAAVGECSSGPHHAAKVVQLPQMPVSNADQKSAAKTQTGCQVWKRVQCALQKHSVQPLMT